MTTRLKRLADAGDLDAQATLDRDQARRGEYDDIEVAIEYLSLSAFSRGPGERKVATSTLATLDVKHLQIGAMITLAGRRVTLDEDAHAALITRLLEPVARLREIDVEALEGVGRDIVLTCIERTEPAAEGMAGRDFTGTARSTAASSALVRLARETHAAATVALDWIAATPEERVTFEGSEEAAWVRALAASLLG